MSNGGSPQARRPAGTPTGGQFAPTNRPEASGVDLVDDDLMEAAEADAAPTETPTPSIDERLAALDRFTRYGPEYDRNVVSAIDDYYHFNRLGEHDAAEHYLLLAELRADKYTWEQFSERDPFERIHREHQAADAPQLTVEEPAAIAVRPENLVWHHDDDNQNDDVAADRADHLAPARPSAKEIIARIFPDGEPQHALRGHKLLPQGLIEHLPKLYETEDTPVGDTVVFAHYFTAGADWYIAELDPESGVMFGHCDLGLGFPEWGYVRIQELAELRGNFGLPVERELDFMPRTARELGLVKEAS